MTKCEARHPSEKIWRCTNFGKLFWGDSSEESYQTIFLYLLKCSLPMSVLKNTIKKIGHCVFFGDVTG